jgi:exodeoxyribonuclease VII small subunit
VNPGVPEGVDIASMMREFRAKVEELENGSLSLEQALAVHEEAVALQRRIDAELDRVERRVVRVIGQDGVERDFTTEPTH